MQQRMGKNLDMWLTENKKGVSASVGAEKTSGYVPVPLALKYCHF